MTRIAASLVVLAACHHHRAAAPVRATAPPGDELVLYRDRALIKQRVEIDIPTAARATVTVRLPIGVAVEDVAVLDRGELDVSELRAVDHPAATPPPPPPPPSEDSDSDDIEPPPPAPTTPTEITFVVGGPHAGHYALSLGYVTERITWDAAYTLTTTPARTQVTLRGAIAITNATGVAFPHVTAWVADTELGAWRGRVAEQLPAVLTGAPAETGVPPILPPRPLGVIALGTGETRLELLPGGVRRPMRSVLVYDPIGTKLDHASGMPARDPTLGVVPAAGTRVLESFEIERAGEVTAGLPGGPTHLLERRPDGSLIALAETRLFDASARVADADTVSIGTADGVTAKRERHEFTVDDDHRRIAEEILITITNKRAVPVDVVLREHLYRGQNWTIGYHSADSADKEGSQQVVMRARAPAHAERRVLYVVVYPWDSPPK